MLERVATTIFSIVESLRSWEMVTDPMQPVPPVIKIFDIVVSLVHFDDGFNILGSDRVLEGLRHICKVVKVGVVFGGKDPGNH